jgi:uncharacterized protein YjlB
LELQEGLAMPIVAGLKRAVEKLAGIARRRPGAVVRLAPPQTPEVVRLREDGRTPNNPKLPLVIHRRAVRFHVQDRAALLEELFLRHGWRDAWRDGIYDFLHFHTGTHEVLGIARGRVTVQFGGPAGPKVTLHAGDVAVLPAGTGHRRVRASRHLLVVGAYPDGGRYDEPRPEQVELAEARRSIAAVPRPRQDPVYGANGPLMSLWKPALTPRQRQVARSRRSRGRSTRSAKAARA